MANEVSKYLRSGGYDWGGAAPAGPAPVAPMTPTDRPFVDRITGDYSELARNAASRWGVDPRIGPGMMLTESSGNPNAHNKGSDAVGLFQMTPIAVKEVNRLYGTNYSLEDRWDPEKNADMAMAYFRAQLEKAGGDTELALRYYNGGYDRSRWGEQNAAYAGKVLKNGSAAFDPDAGDQQYARDAMQNAMRYNAPEMTDFGRRMDMAMAQYDNDLRSGGSGYLQSLMGDTTGATNAYRDMMAQNQEISGLAKPQDQFSKIDWSRPSELMDYGSGLLGELTGNVAKTGGYALGGAALGGVVGALTPIPGGAAAGANIGARLGAFVPTAARYIGNNWGNSLEEDLKGIGQPTDTQVRSAIESQDALDNARIAGVGVGRAALETAGLGGMASLMGAGTAAKTLLPGSMGGKAIDVLSSGIANPLAKGAAGAALGGVEEVGDTYLEAVGAGRPVSSVSSTDVLDSFVGGAGGHGMAVGGANAITNYGGTKAAVKSLLPGQIGADNRPNWGKYMANAGPQGLSKSQYTKNFYNDKKLREQTSAAVDQQVATQGLASRLRQDKAVQDQVQQEVAPLPSYTEIYKSLKAEHDAKLKVTEDDYQQAVNQFQQDDPEADLPATLTNFAAFKKAHKESMGKAPTMADAQAEYRRLAEERKGPPAEAADTPEGPKLLTHDGTIYQGQDPDLTVPEGYAQRRQRQAAEAEARKQAEIEQAFADRDIAAVKGQSMPLPETVDKEGDLAAMQRSATRDLVAQREKDLYEKGTTSFEPDLNIANKAEPTAFKKRPSVEIKENLEVVNAQARESQKANKWAEKVQQAKDEALAKVREHYREKGAQIEDGDQLQWKNGAWDLYPANHRGRPPTGKFYADIFDDTGKIGKVLRDKVETPETGIQPTQEVSNETTNAIPEEVQGREGNPEPAPQARRRRSRRVQKESQAVDATQGQEVTEASALTPRQQEFAQHWDGLPAGVKQELGLESLLGKDKAANVRRLSGAEAAREIPLGLFGRIESAAIQWANKNGAAAETKKAEPTVDDLIAKVDEIRSRPKKTRKVAKEIEQDFQEGMQSEAEGGYASEDNLSDIVGTWTPDDVEFMATGKKKAKGVSRAVAEPIAKKLQKEVGDRLGVKIEVYDNPAQIFGPNAAVPDNTKGFYHSGANTIGVFVGAADSVRDLQETLDHELAGHFGLNTLRPEQKRSLLTDIARSLDNRFIKAAFDKVKQEQTQIANDDFKVAEEVFARAAESIDKFWSQVFDAIVSKLAPAMRKMGLLGGQTSLAEIRQKAREIGKSIRDGSAVQQTFPEDKDSQYRGGFKDFVDQATESELGATTWGKFKDFVNDMKTMPNTLMYLSEWLPDRKSLKALYTAEKAMQASQGKIANQVSAEVDNIRALANQDRKQLFRVMTDATLSRAHPDADFDDKVNAHLEESDRQAHAALQARYEKGLSPEAKKAYKATRDMFQNMTAQRIAALNKLADNMLDPEQRDAFQREIDLITRMSPGPYFPLTRFGDYVASWRSDEYVEAEKAKNTKLLQQLKADENHYRVSFEPSMEQAKALSRKWGAEGGVPEAKERIDFEGGVNIAMKPLLDRMAQAVELSLGGNAVAQEAVNALRQTFIAALPDTSILHSALKRQNVAGVKPDQMLMAIAKHGSSQAFHLSRLEHMPTIQDGLKELRKEDNKAINAGDDVSIYAMVSKGLTGALTPDPTSLAATVTRLATYPLYAGRLALNPSFWLTNLMAPLVITAPYIGGRYGNTAAVAALRDAGADAIKILTPKKGQRGFKDLTRFSFLDNIDQAALPADEVTMLKKLMDEGLIDENQIRELANIADGNIGAADDIKRVIGAIPHRVEGLNRISSALAAYRLEAKRNGHEAGMAYAEEVVTKTQINYTVAGTPFILRRTGALGGPVGKLFTQFMRYQIGMGLLMAHTAREAFNPREGTPQATIDEARRKLTGLVTAHALVTGTNGFFGASAMLAVAQWISDAFHDDDDEPDLENELKKLTDYTFGKKGSLVLRKGLPALMGIDLSQRVGMGDLLNIRRNNPLKGDGREMRAGVVDAIPALSNTIDWIDWAKGGFDPKKIPVSLVSNIAKSMNMSERGMVNTHGVTKIGPEEFTFADTISQALGFAPLKSNEAYKAQSVVRETEMAIQSRRQELMDQWNEAMSSGDADALAEARKEIVKFNERHSGKQDMVISTKTLTKSRKQRMSRQGRMTDQGVYIPKRGEWRQRLLEETQ